MLPPRKGVAGEGMDEAGREGQASRTGPLAQNGKGAHDSAGRMAAGRAGIAPTKRQGIGPGRTALRQKAEKIHEGGLDGARKGEFIGQ